MKKSCDVTTGLIGAPTPGTPEAEVLAAMAHLRAAWASCPEDRGEGTTSRILIEQSIMVLRGALDIDAGAVSTVLTAGLDRASAAELLRESEPL